MTGKAYARLDSGRQTRSPAARTVPPMETLSLHLPDVEPDTPPPPPAPAPAGPPPVADPAAPTDLPSPVREPVEETA